MRETTFNPEDMPILNLDTSGTSRYEASHFLDSPEVMAAYIAESMKAGDTALVHALGEVAKARGVNKVAQDAGVNRESLYKVLKGGAKTRFETIRKLMTAIGLELTVRPIEAQAEDRSERRPVSGKAAAKPVAAKRTAKAAVTKVAAKPAVKAPAAKAAAKPAPAKPIAKYHLAKPFITKSNASSATDELGQVSSKEDVATA
jgi:probable addiction module antidote protein